MTPPSNRRTPGTGSLFQLKTKDHRNGYWVGLHWVTDASGNKKRVPVGDWDRDAAEAKLDALVAGVGLPANLVELRAVKAAAWDEGEAAGWENADNYDHRGPNPSEKTNPYKSPLGGTK